MISDYQRTMLERTIDRFNEVPDVPLFEELDEQVRNALEAAILGTIKEVESDLW